MGKKIETLELLVVEGFEAGLFLTSHLQLVIIKYMYSGAGNA